jgi:IS5 family transposase
LLSIDSFSVEANTCWPTDSGIIMSLLNRVWRCGQKLKDFDLPGFTPGCVEQWLKQLKKIDFAMNCVGGKPGAAKKLRKLYSQYLDVAAKIINRLAGQLEALTVKWEALDIVPSQQRQAEAIMEIVNDDLAAVVRVCEYTGCRIFKNIILPSAEKILSLSDSSAAFIKKGGREPKIGYKPQVARSGNGFITAFELEQGNPADSARLLPATRQHQRNTGITPNVITVDDGYSSKAGRDELLEEISTVSINGSKGKKITSEEQWNSAPYADARNMRSAVESLVFTLRYKFSLYRFSRRGIEAVKGEMAEKIIVHNFWRIGVIMRKREMDNLASRPPARKAA